MIVGDANNSTVELKGMIDLIPEYQITYQRYVKNKLRQSKTDIFQINQELSYSIIFQENNLSDHTLINCQLRLGKNLRSKKQYNFIINKEQVYLLNLNYSHCENFGEFIQKIQENKGRFQLYRRIRQGLESIIHRTSQDFLNIFQLINSNIRTKKNKITHKLINKLVIVNPNKRDGGIMNCYIDSLDNLITDQQTVKNNVLQILGDNQGLINFQPLPLPELEPITFQQYLYMKSRISQNKALTNVLISDTWISKYGSFIILNDVWRSSTQDLVKNFGEFFIIPLNKNYPNIPQANEFRPITILSPLYKWLELRFEKSLSRYCESKIIKQQVGFIKGFGTQFQILKLIKDISRLRASDNKLVIFIDFKSAYNTANLDLLYRYMQEKTILAINELNFLKALISNQYYDNNGVKYSFRNGVPQGSILSPYLFDIYTDLFIAETKKINIEEKFDNYYFYADDLAIICSEQYVPEVIKGLELVAKQLCLIINTKKCAIMKLHQGKKNFQEKVMNGFSFVRTYRYLGVEIDNKGRIGEHLEKIQKRMNYYKIKFLGILKNLEFGNRFLLWVNYMKPYFSYILSIMETQKQKEQNKMKILWKRSLKEWLLLPKITSDIFLEGLTGKLQDIASFQIDKMDHLIDSRYNQEFTQEGQLYQLNQQQRRRLKGIKNIPENIRELFLLPIRICSVHKERMTFSHQKQMHQSDLISEALRLIKSNYKLKKKKIFEKKITDIQKEAGDFIKQKEIK